MEGVSGMLGGSIVFRLLRGETIVARRPRTPSRQSEAQRASRHKFRDATRFAKAAMADPVKKEYYWNIAKKLELPNAYTAAITDFMRKANVEELIRQQTKKGLKITIHAFKKAFALKQIAVQCLDMHRQVIDLYEATPEDVELWKFDMSPNPEVKVLRFIVTDNTGQTSNFEKPCP